MTSTPSPTTPALDPAAIRADFPILSRLVRGHRLAYLDNAATAHKPRCVIDAISHYYETSNANPHRGTHMLGEEATALMEGARERVARFIDADPRGVVFVRNTTEALNLVAHITSASFTEGSRIVVSPLEHHSNLVPWQLAAQRHSLSLEYIDVTPDGYIEIDAATTAFSSSPAIVSLTHTSNVLGTIQPTKELVAAAHAMGALVCIDGAQAVPHGPVSVRDLDCDFFAFSGHKIGAPQGIGVLWGRPSLLEKFGPFLAGGSMIGRVERYHSSWAAVPHKFEAGTPDVASMVGLTAACDYLDHVGREAIAAHEKDLYTTLRDTLRSHSGVTVLGGDGAHCATVSFVVDGIHPHDVATIADREGVAVRAGHHCAEPLMRLLGVPATTRASGWIYTSTDDIAQLDAALTTAQRLFS